jgi:predicted HTH domain antitoxin
MTRSIHIEYPSTLPDALRRTRAEFERDARLAMAVKLFEMKRLSSRQAALLAGLDRTTFLVRLSEIGVPLIDVPPEELATTYAMLDQSDLVITNTGPGLALAAAGHLDVLPRLFA